MSVFNYDWKAKRKRVFDWSPAFDIVLVLVLVSLIMLVW